MKRRLLVIMGCLLTATFLNGMSLCKLDTCLICCEDIQLKANKVCSNKYEGVIIDGNMFMKDIRLSGFVDDTCIGAWEPESSRIAEIEELLIKKHQKGIYSKMSEKFYTNKLPAFRSYIRQYIGLINNHNDTILLITFSYFESRQSFKFSKEAFSSFYRMDDGQYRFFYLVLDVKSGEIRKLKFNGKA